MSTTLAAGIASAKTAFDIIKGIKNIDDQARLNTVIIDAQQHVLTVQESMNSALIDIQQLTKEKDGLESKLVEQSEWHEKQSDYRLIEVRELRCQTP